MFDFNDPSFDLRGKEIKRQALQEMLEYVATTRGVITDSLYPDVIRMVRKILINYNIYIYVPIHIHRGDLRVHINIYVVYYKYIPIHFASSKNCG